MRVIRSIKQMRRRKQLVGECVWCVVIIIAAVIMQQQQGGEVGKCAVTVNCDDMEEQMRL